jgi:large subunit ribosomal protein L15
MSTTLSNLKPRPGSRHRVKRLGCGESSGHGKTCGKGHKGQKARSGGSIRLGFEGGQMPLARKIPKRGFSNERFRTANLSVNIGKISQLFDQGAVVDAAGLKSAGLVPDKKGVIKVLGGGDVKKALHLKGLAVSASAKAKLEAAGGSLA